MVVALVLFLAGVSGIWAGTSGKTGLILAAMPDPIVLWLTDLGVDEALDELVVRTSKVPSTMSAKSWDDTIEQGLAFQANTTLNWDPRWGEIISLAWQGNHPSEEQKLRFAINAQEIEFLNRDRMRIYDRFIPNKLEESSTRGTAINRFQTGYTLRLKDHASGGQFGDEIWENTVGGSMSTTFSFPRAGSTGTSSMGSGIAVPKHIREQLSVGDELTVYSEFQYLLERQSDGSVTEADPIRFERTVRVVAADEPLIRVVQDPKSAEAIIEGAKVGALTGLVLGSIEYKQYDELASISLRFSNLPRAVSGEVFLQHPDDGERIFVGTMVLVAGPEAMAKKNSNWFQGYQIGLTMNNELDLIDTLNRVTRDRVVNVIFETEPTAAERYPSIDEVVDLDMRFVGVPVQWFTTRGEIYESQDQTPTIPASEAVDN